MILAGRELPEIAHWY